ncbi:uncharacterized protein NPIL_588851, partial [Nephila pilipes]
ILFSFDRNTTERFDEDMDKIISRDTFAEVQNKELAFENMYDMLKFGGEIGITFPLNSLLSIWLKEIASIAKWKAYHTFPFHFYPEDQKIDYYMALMEEAGFRNIRSVIQAERKPYVTDEEHLESLLECTDVYFNIPSEMMDEYKKQALKILLGIKENQPDCYTFKNVYLFAVKPLSKHRKRKIHS